MSLLRKLKKLISEPGFKAQPATTLLRAAQLALYIAMRFDPVFCLSAGGALLTVPANLRYTSVSAYMFRE